MSEIDPIILRLIVDDKTYRAALRAQTRTVDQEFGRQEKRARMLEQRMRASSSSIAGSLKTLAAGVAGYFGVREIANLTNSFTRLQNQLKVAGLEGAQLAAVQERLYATGAKYGVSVNSLAELYGKASQAARELGAGQEQLLALTEATSQSLLITGTSTEAASGAILGLTQALSSGIVRVEEYNQLNEGGLRPLLEAAAATDRFGGSVNKLRAAVANGKVSSQELYQAILANADLIEKKASAATLTLAGAFQSLRDQIGKYIGEAGQSTGATAAVAAGIKALADNVDTLIPALAIVATALGVGMVANAVKAQVAMNGVAGTAVTMRTALLGAFGGPVGLAITAFIVGMGSAVAASQEAEAAMLDNARAAQELGLKLSQAEEAALAAAGETAGVGSSASASEPKVWAFANAVDGLTVSLWEQAKAARAARIELLKQQEGAANERIRNARLNTTEGQGKLFDVGVSMLGEGNVIGGLGAIGTAGVRRLNNFFRGGEPAETAQTTIRDANRIREFAVGEIIRLQSEPIGAGDLEGAPTGSPSTAGTGGSKRGGRAGASAEELARRAAQAEAQTANEIGALWAQRLRAIADATGTAEDRARAERASLVADRNAWDRQLDLDENLADTQRATLVAARNASNAQQRIAIEHRLAEEVVQERREAAERDMELANDALARQGQTYEALADIETNTQLRNELERRALDAHQQIERNLLAQAIASGEVADAEKANAVLALQQAAQRQRLLLSQLTPGQRYIHDLKGTANDLNEEIERIEVEGLRSLNDELADAILGAKSLGDVFSAVADQIIADLVRIAIQQAIIKPLAGLLFGGTGGGGGLFGSIFGSLFGGGGLQSLADALPGRAAGGPVRAGAAYMVGERGRELFIPQSPGFIVPNQALRGGQGGGVSTVRLMIEEAEGFAARVQVISANVGMEIHRVMLPGTVDLAAKETMRRAGRPRI